MSDLYKTTFTHTYAQIPQNPCHEMPLSN